MTAVELITKKRNNHPLSEAEIQFLVTNYNNGAIPDYQMAAFAMACYFRKLTAEEIWYLTNAFIKSGEEVAFPEIARFIVDKHSTGGVGDKVSLVLGPLVACFDIVFAKISGRGLGYTGGTIDKLETIPGFRTSLSVNDFKRQLQEIGIAIISQTADLVPVDKKLYALRDVTATTDILGLIVPSILSKKLVFQNDLILLDVKCGDGAFFPTFEAAQEFALLAKKIVDKFNRKIVIVITDMNEPLGQAVGNTNEIIEAMSALQGKANTRFTKLVVEMASLILVHANKAPDMKTARIMVCDALHDGRALAKFREFVTAQGGNLAQLQFTPKYKHDVLANQAGYLQLTSALVFGKAAMELGAGRAKYTDTIDYNAGIFFHKKTGDTVNAHEPIFTLYADHPIGEKILESVQKGYKIVKKMDRTKTILATID